MMAIESASRKACKCESSQNKMAKQNLLSPQMYLDLILRDRGYSTCKYRTLDTGYYSRPSALQQASYNSHLIRLIRAKNATSLKSILESGLSPNPCNKSGQSLIHIICSLGDANILRVQLEIGGSVQVSDRCGQTPLHEICKRAKPCFKMAEMIARKDANLFQMRDIYGATPLSYIHEEHWSQWIDFLDSNMDMWWPENISMRGKSVEELIKAAPNSNPFPDPKNALTVELASMVASGSIQPKEALLFIYDCAESKDYSVLHSDYNYDEADADVTMVHLKKHLSI